MPKFERSALPKRAELVEVEGFTALRKTKANGKERIVYMPDPAMRARHEALLARVPKIEWQTSLSCVGKHLQNDSRYYLKLDMSDAYGNVDTKRLTQLLVEKAGNAAEDVANGFFHPNGGIIQGAPASPYLFEFYCRESGLDDALRAYQEQISATPGHDGDLILTRYMDDIVVSRKGPAFGKKKAVARAFEKILTAHGFPANAEKREVVDTEEGTVLVLGVAIHNGVAEPKFNHFKAVRDKGNPDDVRDGVEAWMRQVRALN